MNATGLGRIASSLVLGVALSATACGGIDRGRPSSDAPLAPLSDPGSGPVQCSADEGLELSYFADKFELGAVTGGWYMNNEVCNACNTLQTQWMTALTELGPSGASTADAASERVAQLKADLDSCLAILQVECPISQTPQITAKPFPAAEILPSPRCGSRFGFHVVSGPFVDWGGVIGIQLSALDAHEWTGISFWARVATGSGTNVRVQVTEGHTDQAHLTPAGTPPCISDQTRDNTRLGCDAFGSFAVLSSDWRFFTLPFTEMRQGGWGVPAPFFDLTTLMSIQFQYPAGRWDLWLDDVALYRGKVR